MAVRARASEKTLLIVSVAVFVVLIGLFTFLSYTTKQNITKAEDATRALKVEISKLDQKIKKIPAAKEKKDELEAMMEEYERILPDAEEIENLMTMLSEQAVLSDCNVSDFSPLSDSPGGRQRGTAAAAGSYKKVKFDCTVSSSKRRRGFYCASKFLNLLERYERFISTDEFTLRAGTDAETAMHLDLTAHTYTFTGTMAATGAAAGKAKGSGRGGRR